MSRPVEHGTTGGPIEAPKPVMVAIGRALAVLDEEDS